MQMEPSKIPKKPRFEAKLVWQSRDKDLRRLRAWDLGWFRVQGLGLADVGLRAWDLGFTGFGVQGMRSSGCTVYLEVRG